GAEKRTFRSFNPRNTSTRSMGRCDSRQGARYFRPFRPGITGSSQTVVRPLRPSSMTRYPDPSCRCSTPVQRTSYANRAVVSGLNPQVLESPKQRMVFMLTEQSNTAPTEPTPLVPPLPHLGGPVPGVIVSVVSLPNAYGYPTGLPRLLRAGEPFHLRL